MVNHTKSNTENHIEKKLISRLIIVDDDIQICDLLTAYTCDEFQTITFQNAYDFLNTTFVDNDIILLDLKMPDIDGVEVIRKLAKLNKNCPLLLMSGYDEGVLHSALQLAKEYGLNVICDITKPIDFTKLMGMLFELKTKHSNQIAVDSTSLGKIDLTSLELLTQDHIPSPETYIPNVAELASAISEHQLVLFYQPQLSFKNNHLIGVEALVRWQHPIYGLLFPDQFIPLAENSGLIEQLTKEVIRLSIAQSKLWKSAGRSIKISINISAKNITSLVLPEQLTHLVCESEIDPSMIMLEITETELMRELTTSLDILTRLRLKGFQLSIDDFGTGYSSLSQLHRAPFTELKIDQSFTMTMLNNVESKAIVETCIMLGHNLNMEVIAEGVENQEIWDLLKTMGCDNAQGYFIAKPLPIEQFSEWLNQFNHSA